MKKGLFLITRSIKNQVHIRILNGFTQTHIVENIELVQNKISHFYKMLEKICDNQWDEIVQASDDILNALFPNKNVLEKLYEIFESYVYINIVSDKKTKYFLDIPWELLHLPLSSKTYLGQNKIFQRSSTDMPIKSEYKTKYCHQNPKVGFIKCDHLEKVDDIQDYLIELAYSRNLTFCPCQINSVSKHEYIEEVSSYMNEWNIAHVNCLMIKFRDSEKERIVLSEEFLLSTEDIKKLQLNEKNPIVLFDVFENTNTCIYTKQRNNFLSKLIQCGSKAVVTNICSLPRDLVNDFYCDLHKNLSKSQSIHEALLKARQSQIYNNNPYANLFWLYGNASFPQNNEKKVFLSHSHADKNIVEKLKNVLEDNGIKTWYDDIDMNIGDIVNEKIIEGITQSDCFLFVISPNSVKSNWVKYELSEAYHQCITENKKIFPVLIGDLSEKDIPQILQKHSYSDLRNNDIYYQSIKKLCDAINTT